VKENEDGEVLKSAIKKIADLGYIKIRASPVCVKLPTVHFPTLMHQVRFQEGAAGMLFEDPGLGRCSR
jgi:hypothetical protein